MKCPSCGAETSGKFCEYCGSEMPKGKVVGKCPKCGDANVSFKRERVGTATQSRSHKNAFGNGRNGHSVSQTAYRTVGICQSCGYTWNPNGGTQRSGKKTWLWVLGWICIFPLPLTILMLRKKNMKPAVKYGIIAAAWLLFFAIGSSGNSEAEAPASTVPAYTEAVELVPTEEPAIETNPVATVASTTEPTEAVLTAATYIDDVVNRYNAQATEQLVFVESFDPQNKENGHYRVEFRLSAYDDAIGKSYLLGDKVVDLVASESWSGINFRVYTNDVSLEQVIALIQGMSPIMDATLTDADLQATIDKVSTEKTANGHYYGELGITLFGSDVSGYELMIKND